MDIFSHTLWGYGFFGRQKPWLAMAFGAMPDMVSFGVFAIIRFANGDYVHGKPPLDIIPGWCFVLYDLSHSLFISMLVLVFVLWKRAELGLAMLAWPFHILLDIPFHTRHYFPTKFFYPLSDYFYDGIAWSTPAVWLPNFGGVVLVVGWRLWRRRRVMGGGE